MKLLIPFGFALLLFTACQPKSTPTEPATTPDATAAAPAPAAAATVPDQKTAEDMAAFYTGTIKGSNGQTVNGMVTLNADEARTCTVEETATDAGAAKSELNGKWTIANGVVTCSDGTKSLKYKVVAKGLVFLTEGFDGTDPYKNLLTKVLGE